MSTETIEDVKINEKIKKDFKEPGRYKIIMLNDDSTPMEWVIEILTTIFKYSDQTAMELTLQIHNEGSAVVGIYAYEIAEQKAIETINASRERGFPLNAKIEKDV